MSNLDITSLDFDELKNNFKTFLQSQPEFSDFNFEGSGFNVLLDILAYNTHYQTYYASMLLNESFLDSSVKLASAESIAKHLGYTPVSTRGSIANINVKVIDPTVLTPRLVLPIFTAFTTTINEESYTFLTTEAYIANRNGNEYDFLNVKVTQGSLQEYSYVVNDITPNAKYEIPAEKVDTSTLMVYVQKSASDLTTEIYTLAEDLISLKSDSKIYFLQKNPLGRYEIYFGDNILGKSPEVGNIVTLRYLVSIGEETNVDETVTQTFSSEQSIQGSNDISVTVNNNSTNGKKAEGIISIKHYAPKYNASRNRAVTASDYEAIIHANFTGAESISVWGGEDNIPPIYGKVFVSLKPYEGHIISFDNKELIKSEILKNKQGVTIQVDFVDPEYIYVGLDIIAEYNPLLTSKSSGLLYSQILDVIENYFSDNLQQFDKDYKHSILLNNISEVDESIQSVLGSVKLQKRIIPVLNVTNTYNSSSSIQFRNAIKPGTFTSSNFYIKINGEEVSVRLEDLPNTNPPDEFGSGTLRIVNSETEVVINANIGNIDYGIGEVSIIGLIPTSLPPNAENIRLSCGVQERNYNIQARRNEILVLDDSTQSKIIGTVDGLNIDIRAI